MFVKINKELIFDRNPQAPSCHASTLLPLENGDVVAAWFAGSQEGNADVSIWTSVRGNGRWSTPSRISSIPNVAHWNPVLHLRTDGTIVLFYKAGMRISHWQTFFVTSRDGYRWSHPRELVPGDASGGRGPVKNKCLRLSDGRLLAPASIEPSPERWQAFVDESRDDGFTWKAQPLMEMPEYEGEPVGLIQPSLWEDSQGVHCLLRSNQGAIYRSDCRDGSWVTPYRTGLPNNNAGLDLTRDSQGRLWLVYNPVGKNWGPRFPLTLAVSTDGGVAFDNVLTLESEAGEYSYPAILEKDGTLYITYTYNREKIAFWKVELK